MIVETPQMELFPYNMMEFILRTDSTQLRWHEILKKNQQFFVT